jgi:hypothetical protein
MLKSVLTAASWLASSQIPTPLESQLCPNTPQYNVRECAEFRAEIRVSF